MDDPTAINQTTAELDSTKQETSTKNTQPAPSQPSSSSSSSGSWWGFGGILDKVKQQSENVIKIFQEDLAEFGKTIQHDTTEVIKKTAEDEDVAKITSQISTGISNMLGLNTTTPSVETPKPVAAPTRVIVDRHQARVESLQGELSTYCTEPADKDDFQLWKDQFKIATMTDDISKLLATNDKIREIHSKLVPVAVSYADFWERYYYKLNKLNQEEERRAALVKRATNEHVDEEELSWDEEDDKDKEVVEVLKTPERIHSKEDVEEYFEKLDASSDLSKSTDEKVSEPITNQGAVAVHDEESYTSPVTSPVSPVKEEKSENPKVPVKEDAEEGWDSWE